MGDDTTNKTSRETGTTASTTDAAVEVTPAGGRRRPSVPTVTAETARTLAARLLWGVCVAFALVLASAVLLIAVEANSNNDLVRFVIDFAAKVDLGFFSLTNPIKDFDTAITDPAEDVKTALFNYGICAVLWLLVGRILDRVVRP